MTILSILSHPSANPTVIRHWEHYMNAGADAILCSGVPGTEWPKSKEICCERVIGEDGYCSGARLPFRAIETIAASLDSGATQVIMIEYDTIFFRAIPKDLPAGMVSWLAGGPQSNEPKRKGNCFYHSPWIFDQETAKKVVKFGRDMINSGDVENGGIDCFLGWLCESNSIPIHGRELLFYTQNTICQEAHFIEASEAISKGAFAIHGIKTTEQLERIITCKASMRNEHLR